MNSDTKVACNLPALSDIERQKRLTESGLTIDLIPTPEQLQQPVTVAQKLIEYAVNVMNKSFISAGRSIDDLIHFTYSHALDVEISGLNQQLVKDAFFERGWIVTINPSFKKFAYEVKIQKLQSDAC